MSEQWDASHYLELRRRARKKLIVHRPKFIHTQTRRRAIEAELAQLNERIKKLELDDVFWKESENTYYDHVAEYARAETLMLTDYVIFKLPLELRNEIYGYLWASEYQKTADEIRECTKVEQMRFRRYTVTVEPRLVPDYTRCLFSDYPLKQAHGPVGKWMYMNREGPLRFRRPHFATPAFAGEQFAREASTMFYRSTPAIIDRPGRILGFITHDTFQTDVRPIEHLKEIIIYFSRGNTSLERDRKAWLACIRSLSRLPYLPDRSKSYPKLTFYFHDVDRETFYLMMVQVQRAWPRLKRKGATVVCKVTPHLWLSSPMVNVERLLEEPWVVWPRWPDWPRGLYKSAEFEKFYLSESVVRGHIIKYLNKTVVKERAL